MAERSSLVYYGEIKVENGKYEKDGKQKTRYHSIGKVFHSPHMSRMSFYLYPTATSEGKWVNAYPHEEYQKPVEKVDEIHEVTDEPISIDDIPF